MSDKAAFLAQKVSSSEQGSQTRFVLILGALAALGPLSIDMYLPAFPAMAASLGTTLTSVEVSLAAYFAGLSIGQLFYGPISDRYGRKLPMIFGLAVYALASFALYLVQSVEALVALRFLQALGACAGMVISRAVVRDRFGHNESARIFSLLMLVMGVAPILAPLLGGFAVKTVGWRAIFFGLTLFSSLCLLAVAFLLPETHAPTPSVKLSRSLSTYLKLFRDRDFLSFAIPGAIAQAGMFAYITGSPFVFIEYFGIPAENFGWVFGANALGLIFMSQMNTRLLRIRSYEKVLMPGFVIMTLAGLVLVVASLLEANFWFIAVPLFIYVAVLGTTFPNSTAGALANQAGNAGSASALLGTLQMLLAASASGLISQMHATTPLVMCAAIGTCSALALVLFRTMRP